MTNNQITAANIAQKILKNLRIIDTSQIAVENIASLRNAFVEYEEILGSAARLVRKKNTGIIKINSSIKEYGKIRFAIAHELGHFELHKENDDVVICTNEMFLEWYRSRPQEPVANAFAAELLMPTDMFQPCLSSSTPSFEEIRNLTENFKTTLTATSVRYIELGSYPCALVISENSKVKWFKISEGFPYRIISPGERLKENSCAHDFFVRGTVPINTEQVSGDTWLEDYRFGEKLILNEQAFALPSYNTVLSLLWFD